MDNELNKLLDYLRNEIEEEKKAIEEQKRIEEEKLLESKTFTPVTKDLFDEWYKKFLKKVRGDKTKTENEKLYE